jgi:hypothetical protein
MESKYDKRAEDKIVGFKIMKIAFTFSISILKR